MAEWLRRLTRNQFPSGSAGSNPADCENYFFLFPTFVTLILGCLSGIDQFSLFKTDDIEKKILETGGIDPPTSHMLSERSTIWATSPSVWNANKVDSLYQHNSGFEGHCQPIRVTCVLCTKLLVKPSIAQLVERWTVVVHCQISIGRWFKSGSKEFLFWISCCILICFVSPP